MLFRHLAAHRSAKHALATLKTAICLADKLVLSALIELLTDETEDKP